MGSRMYTRRCWNNAGKHTEESSSGPVKGTLSPDTKANGAGMCTKDSESIDRLWADTGFWSTASSQAGLVGYVWIQSV